MTCLIDRVGRREKGEALSIVEECGPLATPVGVSGMA